jgi:hypothetical protein
MGSRAGLAAVEVTPYTDIDEGYDWKTKKEIVGTNIRAETSLNLILN